MFQVTMLKDEHVEPLADAVLEVLEKVGVLCQNRQMLEALESAGARVDYDQERAWLPRRVVEDFVAGLRKEHDGRLEQPAFAPPGQPGMGTQVAQLYYDYPTRQRRQGNKQDFITLIKLGDMLGNPASVGHCLLLTDVPPILEPLEAGLLLAEYAHNPAPPFAWKVEQIDYLIEMGEILGLENWFSWGAICFAHPLRFDRDVADKFVRRVREGYPTGLTAMPIAGLTTPVTVEGFIAVSCAEHVATWFAARAINPNVKLSGSMWGGSVDMRTGHVSYAAFDAMFYTFAAVEFLRRWTGIVIAASGADYCDAREPGLYAVLEKAYKAMMIAAFTGRQAGVGSGMLEEGKTLCPVQLMLERDFAGGVAHLARSIELTPENIAMETILEVGVGLETNYMQTEHTLRHFRTACWLPEFIDRSGWNGFEHEEQILNNVQKRIDELLGQYEKPEGRQEQLEAMRQVIERARRELLG